MDSPLKPALPESLLPLHMYLRNSEPDTRHGYCRCGCGQLTFVPNHDDVHKHYERGVPMAYIHAHGRRSLKRYEIDTKTGCWNWLLDINDKGYGMVRLRDKSRKRRSFNAYRLSYELAYGPVPTGLELDHLCRNPRCINPDHLEPVTHAVNMRRALATQLDEAKVVKIWMMHAFGCTAKQIATELSVTITSVADVLRKKTWKEFHG